MVESPSIDASVLGKILLLQGGMHAFPDTQRMAEFLVSGLQSVPGVSGTAFCLQGNLVAFRGGTRSAPLRCRTMFSERIGPLECAQRCPLASAKVACLELQGPSSRMGGLLMELSDPALFALYRPFLENTVKVVALLLENRRQAETLAQYNANLEKLVAERTRALREREARLQLFGDYAPAALAMFDGEMRYLAVSRRWRTDYGLGGGDLCGLSHYEVFPEIPERWKAVHRRALAGEILRSEADRFDRADGSVNWLRWEVRPWYNPEGDVGGIVIFSEDISGSKRAEAALAESEERLRLALMAAEQGLYDLNLQTGVATVSREYATMLGCDPSTFRETNAAWIERLHPEDRERVAAVFRNYVGGKLAVYQVEFRQRTVAGDWKWILSLGRIVAHDEAGKPVRMVGTHTDITQRKQAEQARLESELRYRSLFDNMLNGFAYCQMLFEGDRPTDFIYLDVNKAFESLTGLKGVVGKKASEAIPGIRETDPGLLEIYGRVARTGAPEQFETYVVALKMWFAISVYCPARNHFVAVFDVITERKQAEAAILELNAELEERVHGRTAELEAANKELEAFSYSVSHDLRAPLRGIDGWSLALLEDCAAQLDARGRQYLDRVRAEAQRMGFLIDDMLELSRVARADMQWEIVDISALAKRVSVRLQEAQPSRRIDFVIEPGLQANGDTRLLAIVMENLLGNAVKFTGTRKQARIEVGQSQEPSERPFFVRDNGVGFDMAYSAKLFGAFHRLHRSSEFPGTGIGLATVQRIVHRHGGRIWAEARPDQGAAFYFVVGEKA